MPAPTFQFNKPPALAAAVTHSATGLGALTVWWKDKGRGRGWGGLGGEGIHARAQAGNMKPLCRNKVETRFKSAVAI